MTHSNDELLRQIHEIVTEARQKLFAFRGLIDEFPINRDGYGGSETGGSGRILVDKPDLLVWWWELLPGQQVGSHWHRAPELLQMVRGDLRIDAINGNPCGRVLTPEQDPALLLDPYESHSCSTDHGATYFVTFTGQYRPSLKVSE